MPATAQWFLITALASLPAIYGWSVFARSPYIDQTAKRRIAIVLLSVAAVLILAIAIGSAIFFSLISGQPLTAVVSRSLPVSLSAMVAGLLVGSSLMAFFAAVRRRRAARTETS